LKGLTPQSLNLAAEALMSKGPHFREQSPLGGLHSYEDRPSTSLHADTFTPSSVVLGLVTSNNVIHCTLAYKMAVGRSPINFSGISDYDQKLHSILICLFLTIITNSLCLVPCISIFLLLRPKSLATSKLVS